jgi:hypothetical protein
MFNLYSYAPEDRVPQAFTDKKYFCAPSYNMMYISMVTTTNNNNNNKAFNPK